MATESVVMMPEVGEQLPGRRRGRGKQHICPEQGCKKTFSRAEHLQRHALNHTPQDLTCNLCSTGFKRKDLLDRHLKRHREKDQEAGGGEGSGVLNTRKRMWKDANGNIVTTKRPKLPLQRLATPASGHDQPLPSPPNSRPDSAEGVIHSGLDATTTQPTDGDSSRDLDPNYTTADWSEETELGHISHSNDFWAPVVASYPQALAQTATNAPFDEVFNPDTASSFNMPFTTIHNYNWLFDVDLLRLEAGLEAPVMPVEGENFQPMDFNYAAASDEATQQRSAIDGAAVNHNMMQPVMQFHDIYATPRLSASSQSQHGQVQYQQTFVQPLASVQQAQRLEVEHVAHDLQDQQQAMHFAIEHTTHQNAPPSAHSRSSASHATSNSHPVPIGFVRGRSSFPVVDEVSREELLDLVERSGAVNPDKTRISRHHPLLTLDSMQTFCDLFFANFNVSYPLLHRATFEPADIQPLLIMAILHLGASYSSDKAAHQLAVCIHDVIRPQIFSHFSFSAKPELWMLQCILLVECFGKSRAGQKQHDMSHLFHGLLINLIRRSDCQSITYSASMMNGDLEDDWCTWSHNEQKKRLAFLCFQWDVQHAVLFSQSLCMSAFELRSSLPSDEDLWEADSAQAWHEIRSKKKDSPAFLSSLKTLMVNSGSVLPKQLNALSRVLLLHGLMSVSWDLNRRDQTSLGIVPNDPRAADWRTRMGRSYDAWKADFDSFCMNAKQAAGNDGGRRKEVARFQTAYSSIYHAGHVILNAEVLDLQIYAGARHILGRPVCRNDYARAKRVIQAWAKVEIKAAARAAWHAAHIIRDGIDNLDDFSDVDLFHYPWCLYLANITCWAFHHARPSIATMISTGSGIEGAHADNATGDDDDDEMVWDAKSEMNNLISAMTSVRPEGLADTPVRRTNGLTAVIAQTLLKVRWGIIHDAMSVLKGLVPWRLINQYEASQ